MHGLIANFAYLCYNLTINSGVMRYGIITLLFILLVVIGAVAIFGRGGGSDTGGAKTVKLADYTANDSAKVSWTMQGKLVGEDQRKAVRVTVSKNTRTVEILNGYEERVEKSQDFSNSEAAFATFTRALDQLGYGRDRKAAITDERGVCPQGNRYIYRLTDGSDEVMRTWSTNCRSSEGTFGGGNAASAIAQLFKQQITDYNKFVTGIQL
jgi:hypothetical protein